MRLRRTSRNFTNSNPVRALSKVSYLLQCLALASQSSRPEFDCSVRRLLFAFSLSHGLFLFLFNPFSMKNIHVLISGLEPIRTRSLTLRDLAVSHNRIASDGLHVVCLLFIKILDFSEHLSLPSYSQPIVICHPNTPHSM